MGRTEIYRVFSRRILKLSLFFLVGMICFILFWAVKRVKEPKIATSLFSNLNNVLSVKSILFESLDKSFVPQEVLKDFREVEESNFIYRSFFLRGEPLLDSYTGLPLEMYLYQDGISIPFIRGDSKSEENIGWDFVLDERIKLFHLDARDMYVGSEQPLFKKLTKGIVIYNSGSIYQVIELPAGLKEFKINAAGLIGIDNSKKQKDFDYAAAMKVNLDGKILGEVYADEGKMETFIFRSYLSSGWHRIEVAFTNDIWEPEKGLDRNLLVKDIEIYNLLGKVYLKVRKGFEGRYLSKDYNLSYFNVLKDEDKNEVISFFKRRFNIESLRDIVMEGHNISKLIKDTEIANLIKRAIFSPAPTKIKLKVKVPIDGIKLVFGFGVMEEAWNGSGDGVEFRVKLDTKEGKPEEILFSKYINPKTNEADRRWHQGEVDLRRYKGKEIVLVLETGGSPVSPITPAEDFTYDWAVWSD